MPLQAKHGTESGYRSHKHKGEEPCTACVNGYREATRQRKRKQRAKGSTKSKSGAQKMNSIEDHEKIITDLERTIEILNEAIETEEGKSNRNLSGLARALADLHEKVADRKAAIAEIHALEAADTEEEAEDDPFDAFARHLHEISVSDTEDSQDLSTSEEKSS